MEELLLLKKPHRQQESASLTSRSPHASFRLLLAMHKVSAHLYAFLPAVKKSEMNLHSNSYKEVVWTPGQHRLLKAIARIHKATFEEPEDCMSPTGVLGVFFFERVIYATMILWRC